jgi:hypothetical protein
MKTLKLALVATVVAFAMVSVASADGFKSKPPQFSKLVNITIDKALGNAGLVAAMYSQINPADIGPTGLPPFIFDVKYNGNIYRISGTRTQWLRFFLTQGKPPVHGKIKPMKSE